MENQQSEKFTEMLVEKARQEYKEYHAGNPSADTETIFTVGITILNQHFLRSIKRVMKSIAAATISNMCCVFSFIELNFSANIKICTNENK